MRVRAAVLREMGLPAPYAQSRPLEVAEVELEGPGPGELLVKIGAAGLCHSDLSVIDGSRPRPMPMVLGHEAAGTVVEVGPGVDAFAAGDRIALAFVPACGDCRPCRQERPALCEPGAAANASGTLLSGAFRLKNGGGRLHHHLGVSAFADHAVVAAESAIAIPHDLPLELAALFGCAVLTGVGAVLNAAHITADDQVAVFGLGGVGMAAVLGARLAGARTIIGVDVVAGKLELAERLGGVTALPATADVVERIWALTDGGADCVIETAGNADVLAQAYAATRRGGSTVTCGLPHPARMLTIPAVSLTAEERTLRGSYLGSCVPRRDIPRFIDAYRDGRLPVEQLLSHRLTLDEINLGFDRLARGEAVRQVVLFDGEAE
ncbi:MAG TPA: zinc-dependent alcohol dehydrogenase family protein [Solirubrobacteraceae bacterium]|nr:zinc-dependent alcohol dehydrogenase family protein [Solirubrobacteraceae bacterium]